MSARQHSPTIGPLPSAVEPRAAAEAWASPSIRLLAVVAITGGLALVSSVPMPRGPVTGTQGVGVIIASLLVGASSGYLVRSRWALLVAPLAYIVAYELSRIGIGGASLGSPRFDSTNGIAAFLFGRGFHGLLALFPMVVGVSIGLAIVRPRRPLALVPTATVACRRRAGGLGGLARLHPAGARRRRTARAGQYR